MKNHHLPLQLPHGTGHVPSATFHCRTPVTRPHLSSKARDATAGGPGLCEEHHSLGRPQRQRAELRQGLCSHLPKLQVQECAAGVGVGATGRKIIGVKYILGEGAKARERISEYEAYARDVQVGAGLLKGWEQVTRCKEVLALGVKAACTCMCREEGSP